MKICQEKFEYRAPLNENEERDRGWVSFESARDTKGLHDSNLTHYGSLPPGSDLEAQEVTDQPNTPFSMGGETDVSHDWNPEAVMNGYSTRQLRPTDDLYTNEHCDAFYGEMTVDGVTGFLERNNTLDRQ